MKQHNRRKFIAGAIAVGASATAGALPKLPYKKKKQLAHHAFFWLKNPTSIEDRDKLVEGVKSLGAIETIRKIHVGVPAETEKRSVVESSYHVSELMLFDDLAGQKVYQDHPIHLKFIETHSHLWDKVVVYDAMEV